MEDFEKLHNNPNSKLSHDVSEVLPRIQDRIQGALNLLGGAFRPELHADILRAQQTFDVQATVSGLLDASAQLSGERLGHAIAKSFIAHLNREVEQTLQKFDLDNERDRREVDILNGLIEQIRAI